MSTFEIRVDYDKCTGCSLCVNTCPINLEIEPQLKYGESPKTDKVIFRLINGKCRVLNPQLCENKQFQCNLCEMICTGKAITIIDYF